MGRTATRPAAESRANLENLSRIRIQNALATDPPAFALGRDGLPQLTKRS